jgi:pimeloyl-ACP methyl ester carboxylesterase
MAEVARRELPAVPGVAVTHRRVALPDGTHLHVAEAGDGPALVLVHGWPQHWWAWRRLLPALAQEHRVVCPDLRGLGWSDAPRGAYAKERWGADLVALLDALDLDTADLAGHDWGGFAVLLAALRAPERVRSVAALSIMHPWPRPERTAPLAVAAALSYQLPLATPVAGEQLLRRLPALVRELIRRGSHPDHHWRDDELDAYAEVLRAPDHARASSAIYRSFLLREAAALAAGRYRGRRLEMPALMLTGDSDPVVGAVLLDGLEAHARGRARTEVVPRAGHFLPEERPEEVLAALRAHLAAA